jgi:hypothetical protein
MTTIHEARPGDTSTIASPDISVLLSFFRNSYGSRYLGDELFLNDYIGRADKVVKLGNSHSLKAAALIRASRLTAVGTNPNRERYGHRQQTMVELLRASHALQPDGWITIHSSALGMQQAADLAGMMPLHNEDHLTERMLSFGELAIHTLTPSPDGLIVERTGSHHGSDYVQHAWGWQD